MEQDIYGYSLCAALALMIFFGAYFIFSGEPDKPVFRNYIRSRRIMGAGGGIARAFHQLYGASVAAATLHGSGRSHTDESFLILHFRMAVQFRIDITP